MIQEIELLKKLDVGLTSKHAKPNIPVREEKLSLPSRSQDNKEKSQRSHHDDDKNMFKRRKIKCRNIRKNNNERPKSTSPTPRQDRVEEKVEETKVYPKNWTEYKEMNLNLRKDAALKTKLFKKVRARRFE